MLRAAAGCLALAACANAPPAPPAPIGAAPPAPSIDAGPIVAPSLACLPSTSTTDVAFLVADVRMIHVCFAADACFAIDEKTSALAHWTPDVTPPHSHHGARPITIREADDGGLEVCADLDCIQVTKQAQLDVTHAVAGDLNATRHAMVLTMNGATPSASRTIAIAFDKSAGIYPLPNVSVGACGSAQWIGKNLLVTTDDCEFGHARARFYDVHAQSMGALGGDQPVDAAGAFAIGGVDRWAVVAPRALTLVLTKVPSEERQARIDLVPIQTESTTAPVFAAVERSDLDWIVASSTGGVGLVDHTTDSLARTWIVPRCEAAP